MAARSDNMQPEEVIQQQNVGQQNVESTSGGQSQTTQNDDDNLAAVILSGNKSGEWKKTLSGALDEKRLFWALVVLFIFYVGYSFHNVSYDNSDKDEDIITRNCTCNPSHRCFYKAWFSICCILWITCHVLVSLFAKAKFKFKDCCCPCCDKVTICKSKSAEIDLLIYDKNYRAQCCNALKQFCCKIKWCICENDDIHRYENYLWTQYYELYTIGITKDINTFSDDNVKDIFTNHLLKSKPHDEVDGTGKSQKKISIHNDIHNDVVACPKNYYISGNCDRSKCVTQGVIHVVLLIIRLLAQLLIVPLLMIQMFDTYAFLCLAEDRYCTTDLEAQYNLHLDQTAITFGFYCGLMLSYMTSIMLCWIPWPKNKRPKNKP